MRAISKDNLEMIKNVGLERSNIAIISYTMEIIKMI